MISNKIITKMNLDPRLRHFRENYFENVTGGLPSSYDGKPLPTVGSPPEGSQEGSRLKGSPNLHAIHGQINPISRQLKFQSFNGNRSTIEIIDSMYNPKT